MSLSNFRQQLIRDDHLFIDTLTFIEKNYQFQPTAFINGDVKNAIGQNEGSCKVLGVAILEGFSNEEALLAFAEHYRSVLAHPEGSDHQNIRSLQKNGLQAVSFDSFPIIRLSHL